VRNLRQPDASASKHDIAVNLMSLWRHRCATDVVASACKHALRGPRGGGGGAGENQGTGGPRAAGSARPGPNGARGEPPPCGGGALPAAGAPRAPPVPCESGPGPVIAGPNPLSPACSSPPRRHASPAAPARTTSTGPVLPARPARKTMAHGSCHPGQRLGWLEPGDLPARDGAGEQPADDGEHDSEDDGADGDRGGQGYRDRVRDRGA
jgi:hypothetical protein